VASVGGPALFVGNPTTKRSVALLHIANPNETSREKNAAAFGAARALTLLQVMDPVAVSVASGLRSRIEALDMLANNLANSTTGGFKLDREFYGQFSVPDESMEGEATPTRLPVVQKQWTDFSQGTLQPTGGPLDLALSGKGFFQVTGPSGPLYTRNGSFVMSPTGVLSTGEGYPLTTEGGGTIQTQSKSPITIAPDGTVDQDGKPLGKIQVVDFQDPTVLDKLGTSYYTNHNPAVGPTAATNASVQQGKIEASNVSPAESAVRLVGLMRQSEMLQKAIALTTDMNKKALDDVARVGAG
jgi:flagellar basal-body rod protein FlgF